MSDVTWLNRQIAPHIVPDIALVGGDMTFTIYFDFHQNNENIKFDYYGAEWNTPEVLCIYLLNSHVKINNEFKFKDCIMLIM